MLRFLILFILTIRAFNLSGQTVQADKNVEGPPTKIERVSRIDSFLLNPFDLYKFKQKVGQSNSGGASYRPYYFRPAYKGVFYYFMFFNRIEGYLGTNKQRKIKLERGLILTTYKPEGKYREIYLDPTEELIEVIANYNSFELPELAFVGLDTLEIKERLGEKTFIRDNCFVYAHKDRALILGLEGRTVKWLKYVHLSRNLISKTTFNQLYSNE
jgi:hypothetical protein